MNLGTRVFLRDVETLDELGIVRAPALVEPGDLLARSFKSSGVSRSSSFRRSELRSVLVLGRRLAW